MKVIKEDENATPLAYASEDLKTDQEFFLKAVKVNPLAAYWMSMDLKNDEKFALKLLECVSFDIAEKMKEGRESLETSNKRSREMLAVIIANWKGNREFILKAVKVNCLAYCLLLSIDQPGDNEEDQEYCQEILQVNPWTILYINNKNLRKSEFYKPALVAWKKLIGSSSVEVLRYLETYSKVHYKDLRVIPHFSSLSPLQSKKISSFVNLNFRFR